MQMTPEARAWLDGTVRRILARHPLGDAERAGVTYELMSHLHASAEARAVAAGRGEVSREDLQLALTEAGGEEALAAAFVQPLSRPLERASASRRGGAFLVDVLILGIALSFVHNAVTFFLSPFLQGQPMGLQDDSLWGLFPWGFHGHDIPVVLQALVAIASAVVVMGYFTWFEAHEGRSLGKRALDLRVVREDGQPMTYREAFLRNLAKLQPFVFLLDAIIMLLAYPKEKQRVSDRIAGTIVVRA